MIRRPPRSTLFPTRRSSDLFGRSSFVGGLYTGRFGNGYANQVAGVDLFHQFDPSTNLRLQYLGSRTKRSEEHTSELQSLAYLVCRLLLEKKKNDVIYLHRI